MFLYTRGHGRTKFFQNPDGRETTLATGHQDDNKNSYEAKILGSLTFKVFQKHTFFTHKTFATTIAETSRRRNGRAELSENIVGNLTASVTILYGPSTRLLAFLLLRRSRGIQNRFHNFSAAPTTQIFAALNLSSIKPGCRATIIATVWIIQ